MEVYPAIDLMDGRAVRLYRGRRESVKVYGDPVRIAERFAELVPKIHVVDLDGAFTGSPQNLGVVEKIINESGLRVQIGGGFRSYEAVARAYDAGVENVIIGTKAFDEAFLRRVAGDFEGITVSLDSMAGRVSVRGWLESGMDVKGAYELLRDYVDRFVYTSVERDGTLRGIDEIERFWGGEEFIYAGGVSSVRDVLRLEEAGFSGVVIGKALYEGVLSLGEVLEALKCWPREL